MDTKEMMERTPWAEAGMPFGAFMAEAAIAEAEARGDCEPLERWEQWEEDDCILLNDYQSVGYRLEDCMSLRWQAYPRHWDGEMEIMRLHPALFENEEEKKTLARAFAPGMELAGWADIVPGYARMIGGTPALLTEIRTGYSLSAANDLGYIRRGSAGQALRRMLDLAIQSARALRRVHRAGGAHGDVRPGHMQVDGLYEPEQVEWNLRLGGAGLRQALAPYAARARDGEPWEDGYDRWHPQRGYVDMRFCAPEQAEGAPPTRAGDIYSWGVSMLLLFHGGFPFNAYGVREWGPMAGAEKERYFRESALPVPEPVRGALGWCMASEPETRPDTLDPVIETLTQAYHSLTGAPYPRPEPAFRPAMALNNRAMYLIDLGRPEWAGRLWDLALEAEPDSVTALFNRTLYRLRRGALEPGEAERCMDALRGTWGAQPLLTTLREEYMQPRERERWRGTHGYCPVE